MNKIRIEHSTEGPKHDPYDVKTITVEGRTGTVIFREGSLSGNSTIWLADKPKRTPAGRTNRMEFHSLPERPQWPEEMFEKLTGITPVTAERAIHAYVERRFRKHKWHNIQGVPGFPGEHLTMCMDCDEVLDARFNESAVR